MTGFINIDLDPSMKPDLLADGTRLPFKNKTIALIYAGHFLEHLNLKDGKKVVKDLFHILKDYGVFVAVVPDYTKCDGMPIEHKESIILAEGAHKVLIDIERLKSYFYEAGFVTVVEAQTKELKLPVESRNIKKYGIFGIFLIVYFDLWRGI